jgi:hypothetical protein
MTTKFGVAINCLRRNFEGLAFAILTVCFLVSGLFLEIFEGVRAATEDGIGGSRTYPFNNTVTHSFDWTFFEFWFCWTVTMTNLLLRIN